MKVDLVVTDLELTFDLASETYIGAGVSVMVTERNWRCIDLWILCQVFQLCTLCLGNTLFSQSVFVCVCVWFFCVPVGGSAT